MNSSFQLNACRLQLTDSFNVPTKIYVLKVTNRLYNSLKDGQLMQTSIKAIKNIKSYLMCSQRLMSHYVKFVCQLLTKNTMTMMMLMITTQN